MATVISPGVLPHGVKEAEGEVRRRGAINLTGGDPNRTTRLQYSALSNSSVVDGAVGAVAAGRRCHGCTRPIHYLW